MTFETRQFGQPHQDIFSRVSLSYHPTLDPTAAGTLRCGGPSHGAWRPPEALVTNTRPNVHTPLSKNLEKPCILRGFLKNEEFGLGRG